MVIARNHIRVPTNETAMLACARELISRNLLDDARRLLARMLKADPTCIAAYQLLACAFAAAGEWENGIEAWEYAQQLDPTNALCAYQLGSLHLLLGHSRAARQAFEQAVRLGPDEPQNLRGLALALLSEEDFAALQTACRTWSSTFPKPSTHLVVGRLQQGCGRPRPCRFGLSGRARPGPRVDGCDVQSRPAEPPSPDSPFARQLESLRGSASSARDRVNVCFALAHAYEAAQRYADAFACYRDGNAAALEWMAQQGIRYDPGTLLESAAWMSKAYGHGSRGAGIPPLPIELRMILIVGLPRSGTTLVEQILASHSDVSAGGELTLAQECLREFEQRRETSGMTHPVDPAEPRDAIFLMEMREKYLDGLFERGLDARFITDKLPGNFAILGFIRLMFPDATIVHCRREPVAACWSLYTAHFGRHEPYYNSFEHLAHYHRYYRQSIHHWRRVLHPPMIEVDYEALVREPALAIRRLVAACGLTWEPECLDFHRCARPVFTASQMQVRLPVYTSSISKWRAYEQWITPLAVLLKDA